MAPGRILVRCPRWAGDSVMATPALRALRAAHPDAEITLEGGPAIGGLLRGLDSFDHFLPDPGRGVAALATRVRALRAARFDWALLLPDSARAALGPFLARIPRRIGYAREPLRRALVTHALVPPSRDGKRLPVSMVERYLAITRRADCPDRGFELELAIDPEVSERVEKRLASAGADRDDGLLVVAPGASFGPSKLWPASHFAEACDGIARRLGLLPVIAPAPSEVAIARGVASRMSARVIVVEQPTFDLEELKALVARARLVLSNDTGPRQVAVALGRPVVVVMGPTDPRHTQHALERQRVLREDVSCSPCHLETCPIDHRCMTRLQPERAVEAAVQLLGAEIGG